MNASTLRAALAALCPSVLRVEAGLITAVLLACLVPAAASAQLYTERTDLFGDPVSDELFGMHVAASADTIVVGTSVNRHAYVFARSGSGWALQQKFTSTDANTGLASDVAVDGDTMVARGTMYTRSGGTWTPQQSFTWEFPTTALQGDTLVVGSSHNRISNRGTVAIYARVGTTWTQQGGFGPDGAEQFLGDDVALDGNTLIASVESANGAYVYVRTGTTWTPQGRLVLPTGTGWGMKVELEGNTAAVSDPAGDRVYIFTRAGINWTLSQTLSMPATGGDNFGFRLSLKGGVLGVGADTMYYLYAQTASGWVLAQTISRPGYRLEGGLAVADRGKLFVIGNPGDDTQSFNGGIAEAFWVPPAPAAGTGWRDIDIGAVGIAGGSTVNGAQIQVRGSGADIWEGADQFHYRTESMTGDGAIIARVDSAGSGHPWAKAGLMFREDVAPASRNVMALVAAGSPVGMQVRAATADTTAFQSGPWLGAPLWLMLARSGNLFAAYRSNDGDNWTPLGSATVSMPATIHVGLAVSSHDNSTLNTGTFSGIELVGSGQPPTAPNAPSNLAGSLAAPTSVRLQWTDNSTDETGFVVERSPGTGNGTFQSAATVSANIVEYTDTGLANGTTYTYRVRAVRDSIASDPSNTFTITTGNEPGALTGSDLGTVAIAGTSSTANGVVTIDAAGSDIWETSDSGYFLHREITGDFDIRARVTSLGNPHPWAKAGVMVRESLDPRARNIFTILSAEAASGLQVRGTFGAATTFSSGPWFHAPYWVRLVRTGNSFQGSISADGTTWQTVGTATLALPATLRAGLAVSSHVANTTTRATFASLSFGN